MNRTWLVIDTNFLGWRQFHGAARGEPRAVLYGVMSYVRGLVERFGADGVVWTFDRGPYHRTTVFPGYKSTRLRRVLDDERAAAENELRLEFDKFRTTYAGELGYGNVYSRAGYEADDMLAAVARAIPEPDTAILVTGDHDLYQCLTSRVMVFHPVNERVVTYRSFRDEHGIHPTQWVDVKCIAGCNTDDIPGVDGVAELTALRYVRGERVPPAKHAAITRFIESGGVESNRRLVGLPWDGLVVEPPVDDVLLSRNDLFRAWCGRRGINVTNPRRAARVVDAEPDLFTVGE